MFEGIRAQDATRSGCGVEREGERGEREGRESEGEKGSRDKESEKEEEQ